MPLVHANLYIGMYYSRLCLFPPEYQSSIPQIRKKIFCSFYALSLRKRKSNGYNWLQLSENHAKFALGKLFACTTFVGQKSFGEFGRRKFHPVLVVISIKLHNFAFVNISLAERSSLSHNTLSFFPPSRSVGIVRRKCLCTSFLPVAGCL